jgi:hypothetical protein
VVAQKVANPWQLALQRLRLGKPASLLPTRPRMLPLLRLTWLVPRAAQA